MTVKIQRMSEAIGAEIQGIDLSRPLGDDNFAIISNAILENAIVLFREQEITIPQQLAFTKHFGDLEMHLVRSDAHPEFPEVYVLSNIVEKGKLKGTPPTRQSGAWHSDYAYKQIPASVSCFSAKTVPEQGGDTMFANMYAAYDALSEATRVRIGCLKWRTEPAKRMKLLFPDKSMSDEEIASVPDFARPLVRTHPGSGRKALFLGMSNPASCEIVGLQQDEGCELLNEIRAFATEDRFVFSQQWQAGDVMLWDNRATIHRATPWDYVNHQRLAYRVVVKGDLPY
jgi:taurine dioxygenase